MTTPWNPAKKLMQERFANVVEIYYENHVHKKFLADVYAVIPKGKKCALWFTHGQCWMFQIAKRPYHPQPQMQPQMQSQPKQLQSVAFDEVRMLPMPCMDDAWYHGDGTILYGTCMADKKRFSVENVHCFCGGKPLNDGSMNRFIHLFDLLKQCQLELPLRFFMPIMHSSFGAALNDALAITSYDVFCIQHRFLKRGCTEYKNLLIHLAEQPPQILARAPTQSFFPKQAHAANAIAANAIAANAIAAPENKVMSNIKAPLRRTFVLKPDAQNDIYYVLHGNNDTITDTTMIAHIPNYKVSVMMNSIFRNIKENRNLDALEESDDEDEPDDHVLDANKCVRMTCVFNNRFKRWQPCERA